MGEDEYIAGLAFFFAKLQKHVSHL